MQRSLGRSCEGSDEEIAFELNSSRPLDKACRAFSRARAARRCGVRGVMFMLCGFEFDVWCRDGRRLMASAAASKQRMRAPFRSFPLNGCYKSLLHFKDNARLSFFELLTHSGDGFKMAKLLMAFRRRGVGQVDLKSRPM
jgi:hypothetical protein